eukprot:GILI01017327.1.p1 GENE.GILI01017327.1~~GILI01017327.1.p1  ORF type:complete len:1514 (-),score=249.06 GILI01017327.1:40-4224(-)
MTATSSPFTTNAKEGSPILRASLSSFDGVGGGSNSDQLSILVNMPSLRCEVLDSASMKLLGWGAIGELSMKLVGCRDLSSTAIKASCSVRAADMPYAYGGERLLLDVSPEIVADLGELDGGGSMCEVAVAVPPMTVTLPLVKLLAAATYEFQPPARGPYTITNETDISLRIEIGDQSVEVDESSTAHILVPIDCATNVRLVLPEHATPILLDLKLAHSNHKLPYLSTSANMLSIWINHSHRTISITTGIAVISRLTGVADPMLTLRWGDTLGVHKDLECPAGTPVVLPFAVASKVLCFHRSANGPAAMLPIDVLCGMARSSAYRSGKPLQYRMPLEDGKEVVVRVVTSKPIAPTDVPDVAFEVFPLLTIRNDSAFTTEIEGHVIHPANRLNWFTDGPLTVTTKLLLDQATLVSPPATLKLKDATRIIFTGEGHTIETSYSPVKEAASSSIILSYATGIRVHNLTVFPLEIYGRHPSTGKDVPLVGKGVGDGLPPNGYYPIGLPKEAGPEVLRIRPALPNTLLSGGITIGATTLTAGSASCVQGDQVHLFSVSERDSVLTISPMWTFVNNTSIAVSVAAGGLEQLVAPYGNIGLTSFPLKEAADPTVSFSFDGYIKSAPFQLATASQKSATNVLKAVIIPESGLPSCLTLSVDRGTKKQMTITASISSTVFPFEIENRTLCEMIVHQRGQSRQLRLKPFESAPFAFETLTGEQRAIEMEIVGPQLGDHRRYRHIIDPDVLPAPSEGWEITKGLYMTALVSANKATFSLLPDRLLHATYVFRPRFISNITLFVASAQVTIAAPVGSSHRTVFKELAQAGTLGELAMRDSEVYLAKREFELLSIVADDITFSLTDNGRHKLLGANLGQIEVTDVSWRDAKHRCIVSCCRKSDSEPWSRLTLHESTADNATVATRHIIALSAALATVRISLNDRILFTLMAVAGELAKRVPPAATSPSSTKPADITVSPPSRLKVDRVHISAIPVVLTYSRRSDGKYDVLGALALRHLLTSVEAAPIVLSSVSATDYSVIAPEGTSVVSELFMQLMVPVYRSNAVLQSYKLIGSLEVLGNPVMFSSAVGEGIQEFVRLSIAMHPIAGLNHLLSSTGSGFLHSCALFSRVGGKIMGAASLDSGWLTDCDGPNGGGRGQGLITGLTQGASGVVMRPIRGAKTGGVVGALAGVLTGATGAIAKPLSGALFSVANASEGAAESLKRSRRGAPLAEIEEPQDCNNVLTTASWVAAEAAATTPTPTSGSTKADKKKGSDVAAKYGPAQAASMLPWSEFLTASTESEFTTWAHVSRDRHLSLRIQALASGTLRPRGTVSAADPMDKASAERALHLKSTLGVSGMLKYVTLDQFVKCVSWDDAKHAVSPEDFKKKVAPMMLKELEKEADEMRWVSE